MKKQILLFLLGLTILICYKKSITDAADLSRTKEYQQIIDSIYHKNPNAIGIMVHDESPKNKISWSGSSGISNKDLKTMLTPDQPALIASSINTDISAAILRMEQM